MSNNAAAWNTTQLVFVSYLLGLTRMMQLRVCVQLRIRCFALPNAEVLLGSSILAPF
jgi:hypothetical protein